MKVLLIKPPVKAAKIYNVIPPIGLGYLAIALRRRGHEVEILDAIKDNLDIEATIARISDAKPEVAGYQTFSYDVGMVRALSARLKSLGAVQVIGGPHPSGMGKKALTDFPDIDYAIVGEGEKSFPDLLDYIKNKDVGAIGQSPIQADGTVGAYGHTPLRMEIPGLVWPGMKEDQFIPPCFEPDIDKLGFPAWDLHPPQSYPFAPQGAMFRQWPLAPLFITRGCPFPCTFCAGYTITGRKFRHRSVEHVVEEMLLLHTNYGVREFHILDDNFSLDHDFLMRWCKAVIETLPGISWAAPNGMRLDTLDMEALEAMKASGCYYVSVGVESGSDRILKHMRKGFTVDDVRRQVAMIRSSGLDVNGFFILGYPEETPEDIEATIRLSTELDLSRAAYFNFLPLPGTPLFDELYPEGISDGIWDAYFQYNAPFAPKGMTSKDIKKAQRNAHLRFYLRPKIAWRLLTEIRSFKQLYWVFRRASKVLGAGADIIKTGSK